MVFAFKNGPVIKKLKERGKLISGGKVEAVEQIEEDLNSIVSNSYDKITAPTYAYITFNTYEA